MKIQLVKNDKPNYPDKEGMDKEKVKKPLKKWKIVGITAGIIAGIAAIGETAYIKNEKEKLGRTGGVIELSDETTKNDFFNAQFEVYEGDYQKGSSVKMLINKIISNNAQGERIISLNGITDVDELQKYMNEISPSKTYDISFKLKDGLINNVIIEETQKNNEIGLVEDKNQNEFKEEIKEAYDWLFNNGIG